MSVESVQREISKYLHKPQGVSASDMLHIIYDTSKNQIVGVSHAGKTFTAACEVRLSSQGARVLDAKGADLLRPTAAPERPQGDTEAGQVRELTEAELSKVCADVASYFGGSTQGAGN